MNSRLSDLSAAVAILVGRMPAAEVRGIVILFGALEHLKRRIQAEALWLSVRTMRKGEG